MLLADNLSILTDTLAGPVLEFLNSLCRNRGVVPARQATHYAAWWIFALESILGLLKSLKIRAQVAGWRGRVSWGGELPGCRSAGEPQRPESCLGAAPLTPAPPQEVRPGRPDQRRQVRNRQQGKSDR
jgi:hypothetical protein